MRFVRNDVRDHLVSQKNDHGLSYWRYAHPSGGLVQKSTFARFLEFFDFRLFQQYLPTTEVVPHSAMDHLPSDQWKSDLKRRTAVIPIFGQYQPTVRLDNGASDGQPHAHAFWLTAKKRLEYLL